MSYRSPSPSYYAAPVLKLYSNELNNIHFRLNRSCSINSAVSNPPEVMTADASADATADDSAVTSNIVTPIPEDQTQPLFDESIEEDETSRIMVNLETIEVAASNLDEVRKRGRYLYHKPL